jgi:hypothetical protein
MAPERFEDLTQAFGGNGLAGIPNFEDQVLLVRSRTDLYWAVRLSMSQGVAQQIRSNLLESSQIAPDRATDADV